MFLLIYFLTFASVIMRFVHDRLFPVVRHLSENEDRELLLCADYLHRASFSAEQLGLREDLCAPLPAAVVELASLDMRTTPLTGSLASTTPCSRCWRTSRTPQLPRATRTAVGYLTTLYSVLVLFILHYESTTNGRL